jgi:hypothetical protein
MFDYPNPAALAEYLLAELLPGIADAPPVDREEAAIRRTIESIPLARIRTAGLLDALLKLAAPDEPEPPAAGADQTDTIKSMAVEDLVRAALAAGDAS